MKLIEISMSLMIVCLISCNQGPKVLESTNKSKDNTATNSTGIFSEGSSQSANQEPSGSSSLGDMHIVEVLEILPTDKYVYLRVSEEGQDEYWVATLKKEVELNKKYYYKGGLLKTNFESKEYNRIFDKVYLVSTVVPLNHSKTEIETHGVEAKPKQSNEQLVDPIKIELKKNSVSIKELVNNKSEYSSKLVQICGTVIKVNPNIMGKNWIHLQDGSMDDYDFVVTSSTAIPEGHVVCLKGQLKLDQDFGAGYIYEIIVENAELVR